LTSKATSTFFLPDAQRSKYNIITQEVGRMCIGYITLVEENLPWICSLFEVSWIT